MSLLGRRGYSIIELLIALVLLSMVSAAIYKVLVNNQRLYLAQTPTGWRITLQSMPEAMFSRP